MSSFDFPDDLLAAQREWYAAERALHELVAGLPKWVEEYPEGAEGQVVAARERLRSAGETIGAHPYWATVPQGDQVAARMALKQAAKPDTMDESGD